MTNHECMMPEHGSATASAACCRPTAAADRMPALGYFALKWRFWSNWPTWKAASRNTFNCLIGCLIGDLGMIIYIQAYHPHTPMLLTMGLAMLAGLITSVLFESTILRMKERFPWREAVKMAFSMSFLSMVGMELAANATDWLLTGGGRVAMHDPFYWQALAMSVAAGFLAPLPYNYYKFRKHGKTCH